MQDHIPDALITAFERQYDSSWNDPQLRNERLAMRYGWAAAMEAKPCLHQIQEPAPVLAALAAVAVPDEREAFEAWAREYGTWDVERDDVQSIGIASYTDVAVVVAWHAWQARAALAATPAAEHATLPAELATQAAQPVLPTGWVPCVVTYEGQHPEEVAYGPQIMMDRLKKWLERYFEMKAAAPVVLPEPVPTPCRSMFATQREYADAMAQHRKNWAEIEAERGMLATGGQAQAVPLKLIEAINTASGGNAWQGDAVVTDLLDPACRAIESLAPQAQADARDAATFEQRMSDWQHGDALDAERYRWLRSRDLETISQGGVFAGMTPQNVILNEEDLDQAVDAAIAAAKGDA